jgi:hypothetical protein
MESLPPQAPESAGSETRPLNPRQERFCQAFVEYGCAGTAAATARYKPATSRRQGWRLMQDARIQARIAAIQAELARHVESERERFMGKLEVVYRRALQDHHFHAAARAVELQARLACLGAAAATAPAATAPPAAPLAEAAATADGDKC